MRRSCIGVVLMGALMLMAVATGSASAAEGIVVVTWGGAFFEASKAIGEQFTKATGIPVLWELHTGGSAAVLTKIKAAWPSPKYDVIAGWDPLFVAMLREGWTVPLRPEEIPVLKEISDVALFRDPKTKEIHAAGMSRAFTGWAYRADKLGEPMTSIKQLFSPKLGKRVCLSDTVSNTGLQLVAFAMTRGGNEHNIDPGFVAAKEFAKTGNVRAVLKADAEFATQLVRGDCWVAFNNMAGFYAASKEHPIKGALKLSDSKTYVYHEGLTVLKTPRAESAKKFVNFFLGAENNRRYNEAIGEIPTNKGAKVGAVPEGFSLNDDEIKQFGYVPDYDHIIKSLDGWNKRWETEVIPLLR